MDETQPSEEDNRKATRVRFLNREAAEVYLLLDFLSGRADRSLRPTSEEQARTMLQERINPPPSDTVADLTADEQAARKQIQKQRAQIEEDLRDPAQLVLRTMRIKYPLDAGDQCFESNAAFLMRARDVLNSRAAPATGMTIAFTSMLSGQRSKVVDKSQNRDAPRTGNLGFGGVTSWEFAEIAYPWLMPEADNLATTIKNFITAMVAILIITVAVSSYAAWGKVLLDTLDAVRRDDGAIQQKLVGQASTSAIPQVDCQPDQRPQTGASMICAEIYDINVRMQVAHYDLARWENPLRWTNPGKNMGQGATSARKKTEDWAVAAVTVLGNYIMPVLYAFLGSLAFVLRRYYDRLAASLVSPRDRRANYIRLLLGTLIGGCIGLVYSGSGSAQATGTLGLAVTLSTSALAFLAGYGVEGVFQVLDAVITQVFRINGMEKTPAQTSAS